MSNAVVRRFIARVSAIPSSTWANARKYGAIATFAATGWGLAIALMSWISHKYGWSTTGSWGDLLLQGLISIAIICGGCLGISVALAAAGGGESQPNCPGRPVDRLEVRGLSWAVGDHVNDDAWHTLAGIRSDESDKPKDEAAMDAAGDEKSPQYGPLTQTFDNIARILPRGRSISLLVWPAAPRGVGELALRRAVEETRNYGLAFTLQSVAASQLFETVVEAAFSLFDAQPDLEDLLVMSADDPRLIPESSKELVFNTSFVLLARPDRSEPRSGQKARAGSGGGQLDHDSFESEKGITSVEVSLIGFVHRPCAAVLPIKCDRSCSFEVIREAWVTATSAVPKASRVVQTVLGGVDSSSLRTIVQGLMHSSPPSHGDVIHSVDVMESNPSLGKGSSLGRLSYALEAMNEAKAAISVVERTSYGAVITLTSPPDGMLE